MLAFEAAKTHRPDLVVIDWVMPVMDGRETIERLKRDGATRDIPVVMLTSQATVDDKVAALEAGAQDFVTKPFDARELVARLEQQLRWRKLLAEVEHPSAPGGAGSVAASDVRDALARHVAVAEAHVVAGRALAAGEAYRDASGDAAQLADGALSARLLRLAGTMFLTAAERAADAAALQDAYLAAARCFLASGNLRLAKRSLDAALHED